MTQPPSPYPPPMFGLLLLAALLMLTMCMAACGLLNPAAPDMRQMMPQPVKLTPAPGESIPPYEGNWYEGERVTPAPSPTASTRINYVFPPPPLAGSYRKQTVEERQGD